MEFHAAERKKILFIDDNRSLLFVVKRIFETDEVEVHTATSFSEGIDSIDKIEYQCIVTDFDLNDDLARTGADIISYVKNKWPSIKTILWSALVDCEDVFIVPFPVVPDLVLPKSGGLSEFEKYLKMILSVSTEQTGGD